MSGAVTPTLSCSGRPRLPEPCPYTGRCRKSFRQTACCQGAFRTSGLLRFKRQRTGIPRRRPRAPLLAGRLILFRCTTSSGQASINRQRIINQPIKCEPSRISHRLASTRPPGLAYARHYNDPGWRQFGVCRRSRSRPGRASSCATESTRKPMTMRGIGLRPAAAL